MMQVIDILSAVLMGCLVMWAIARVVEVWLNVYDRIRDGRDAEEGDDKE